MALALSALGTGDQVFSARSPVRRRGSAFLIYRGAGRTLLSSFSKQLFRGGISAAMRPVFLFQPRWVPAVASAMSMPCASAASGGNSGLQGSAGWFEAGGFQFLPKHPEIPATLMCAQAVLSAAQLSVSYLHFLNSMPRWHRLPGVTLVIRGVFFFLHSSVAAGCT